MNEYISCEMGEGILYTDEQKKLLVEGLRQHPSTLILLARVGKEYVGLLTSYVNFATFTVKPFVNIHDVIVTQPWRNKGVGRRLLEGVIGEAARRGCSKVTLEVREDNHNARYLYSSLGFADAKPRQNYWTRYI
jgi:ribosomal protein S18 acetylase RimI-like enzyme